MKDTALAIIVINAVWGVIAFMMNEGWYRTCSKMNDDWAETCMKIIESRSEEEDNDHT